MEKIITKAVCKDPGKTVTHRLWGAEISAGAY